MLFDTVALKEYKRVYENILAVEKKLDNARKHLVREWYYWCEQFHCPVAARTFVRRRKRNLRRS